MTKQTDYTVKEVYDSPDKTTYYYVHTPEFNTIQEAEKLRQKIMNNQKTVNALKLWIQAEPLIKHHNEKEPTHYELKIRRGAVQHLNNLIKEATGKDIQELE